MRKAVVLQLKNKKEYQKNLNELIIYKKDNIYRWWYTEW